MIATNLLPSTATHDLIYAYSVGGIGKSFARLQFVREYLTADPQSSQKGFLIGEVEEASRKLRVATQLSSDENGVSGLANDGRPGRACGRTIAAVDAAKR